MQPVRQSKQKDIGAGTSSLVSTLIYDNQKTRPRVVLDGVYPIVELKSIRLFTISTVFYLQRRSQPRVLDLELPSFSIGREQWIHSINDSATVSRNKAKKKGRGGKKPQK